MDLCPPCYKAQPDRKENFTDVPHGELASDRKFDFTDFSACNDYLRQLGVTEIRSISHFQRRYLVEEVSGRICAVVQSRTLSARHYKRMMSYENLVAVIVIHPTPHLSRTFRA